MDFVERFVRRPVLSSMVSLGLVLVGVIGYGRLLRPGMFIEARLATSTRADAVVVPEERVAEGMPGAPRPGG